MEYVENHQKLTKEQKQAVGILSIGTFLEYFDLMLYVHMAVLLNDIFFSKTDTFSSQLLSAFSFSVTYVFRPLGGYFIGNLGDRIGRKYTIMFTSVAMSITCLIMTFLPTYDQVGIIASWAVTLCRIVQGISSMGEKVGAQLYLTETIKPPLVYPAVASTNITDAAGGVFALIIANLSLSYYFNWRVAFFAGSIIAFVGLFARRTLRETRDFADANKQINKMSKDYYIDKKEIYDKPWMKDKISKKLVVAFFFLTTPYPVFFYMIYFYCSQNFFNNQPQEIIQHNTIILLIELIIASGICYLSYFVNPFKILKVKFFAFLCLLPFLIYLFNLVSSVYELILFQTTILLLLPTTNPAYPIIYKSFPILKRFTTACLTYAIARAVMYVVSSFGITILTNKYGSLGLIILLIPVSLLYGWGLFTFIKYHNETIESGDSSNKKLLPKDDLLTIETA